MSGTPDGEFRLLKCLLYLKASLTAGAKQSGELEFSVASTRSSALSGTPDGEFRLLKCLLYFKVSFTADIIHSDK